MQKEYPNFSIITASYNSSVTVQECLDSVKDQSYKYVYHTVIDGNSNDGTVDILKRNELYYWHSRKDDGIADAFNQGIKNSTGNVILFLGADDKFIDNNVLSEAAKVLHELPRPWFVYGDAAYCYPGGSRIIKKNYSLRRFKMYNCLPHQSVLLDRWYFEEYGLFDLSYKIVMDYEHFARFIRQHQPVYWPRTISAMRRDGISSNPIPAHIEMEKVKKVHGLANPLSRLIYWGIFRIMYFVRINILKKQWS